MRIISLNRGLTIDGNNLVFNLDEDLTPEVMALVSYGNLGLQGDGRILRVTVPEYEDDEFDHGFSDSNLATLEKKLKTAAQTVRNEVDRKDRLLAGLAAKLGLPLE